jgi:hypothetical protein
MTVNLKQLPFLFIAVLVIGSCTTYLNTNTDDFGSADLSGMIYDADSQACQGVRVSLDGVPGPVSDVNGRFTLSSVTRGRHTLSVKKDKYEDASFAIEYLNRTQIVYLKIFSFNQILDRAEKALAERKPGETEAYLARAARIDETDPLLLYLRAAVAVKRDKPRKRSPSFYPSSNNRRRSRPSTWRWRTSMNTNYRISPRRSST